MRGNPFFTQLRPGRIDPKTGKEKIFKLVKFRTMSNARDKEGNLLPSDMRINKYGRFLRGTSLDELPELVNILKGESQSYKNDGAGMDTDELKTLWVFTAQIDESPDDETCFCMQVLKRKVFEYEGNVPDHEREMLEKEELIEQTDDLYVNGLLPDNGELSSIDPEMVVDFDGGETFISRSKGNYGKATVSAMVEPTKRTILSSDFDALTGLSYAVYQSYEYRIRLYRISAETYDYLAARYVGKNSFLPVYMGFTPPVYVYTNISGGAGMFGTASTYESEWLRY